MQTVHNVTSRLGEWGTTAPELELKVRYFDVAKVGGCRLCSGLHNCHCHCYFICSGVVFALCCHKDNILK